MELQLNVTLSAPLPRKETIVRLPFVWRRFNFPDRPSLEYLLGRAVLHIKLLAT